MQNLRRRSYQHASLTAILLLIPGVLSAHEGEPVELHDLPLAWEFDPLVVVALALMASLYMLGRRKLVQAGAAHACSRGKQLCFWLGWLSLVIALVSPLHPLGEVLFSAHMLQHEVLMLVSAPLLVLARPEVVFLTALSPEARKHTAAILGTAIPSKVWQTISTPFAAWLIHSVVIWLWHAPRFFQATLTNEFVHALQHVSFLGSAWLFCWSVLHHPDRSVHSRKAYVLAVVYIFGLAMHTSILGALLTFSTSSWYPAYTETMRWGLTPVDDQQLGGLLMWIPGGIVYTIAGLACALKWLRHTPEEPTVTAAKDGRAYPIERGVALELTRQSVVPILLLAIACFAGCEAKRRADIAHDMTGGSAQRGRMMLKSYGCSSCHTIPGVPGAAGLVGPPLSGVSKRTFIAGIMENNVGNLLEWIKDPPKHDSLTVMPNLNVSDNDARDIAAYLYTLR